MGLLGGPCDGCRLRDDTIADLRAQLAEAFKTSLAVIDARAYRLRYPDEERAARPHVDGAAPDTTPGEMRHRRFNPQLTSEEIEAQFSAERDRAQAGAGATRPPEH